MEQDNGASSGEEWRIVLGHPDYIVSSLGRIRHKRVNAPILSGDVDRYGYRRVLLNGKRRKVHRIVCEAFHGPQPLGNEVRHLDGSRSNNSAGNLAWGTRSDNMRDAAAHGTLARDTSAATAISSAMDRRGSKNPNAKLSLDQVTQMKRMSAGGHSERVIARTFGCSPATAHRVISGERHVG